MILIDLLPAEYRQKRRTPIKFMATVVAAVGEEADSRGFEGLDWPSLPVPDVIINGDTMFEPEVYRRLLSSEEKHPITLVTNTKPAYDSDDMKVITAGLELKRVGKKLQAEHVTHESIGMIRFNQAGAARFVQKIESLMQHESTLARWYLSAVDELAADKLVGICDITGLGWCELDDMDDLAHAERVVPAWWERVAPLRKESGIQKA